MKNTNLLLQNKLIGINTNYSSYKIINVFKTDLFKSILADLNSKIICLNSNIENLYIQNSQIYYDKNINTITYINEYNLNNFPIITTNTQEYIFNNVRQNFVNSSETTVTSPNGNIISYISSNINIKDISGYYHGYELNQQKEEYELIQPIYTRND